jgi:cystathionine beta-lyase/cystathionine gamma-synthase
VKDQLPLLGIPTHLILGHEKQRIEALLLVQLGGLIFCETLTNPTLEIFDIAGLGQLAHAHGALLVGGGQLLRHTGQPEAPCSRR